MKDAYRKPKNHNQVIDTVEEVQISMDTGLTDIVDITLDILQRHDLDLFTNCTWFYLPKCVEEELIRIGVIGLD